MKYICNDCGHSDTKPFDKCVICDGENIVKADDDFDEKRKKLDERIKREENYMFSDGGSGGVMDVYEVSSSNANFLMKIGDFFCFFLLFIAAIAFIVFTLDYGLTFPMIVYMLIVCFVAFFVRAIYFWMALVLKNLADINKNIKKAKK